MMQCITTMKEQAKRPLTQAVPARRRGNNTKTKGKNGIRQMTTKTTITNCKPEAHMLSAPSADCKGWEQTNKAMGNCDFNHKMDFQGRMVWVAKYKGHTYYQTEGCYKCLTCQTMWDKWAKAKQAAKRKGHNRQSKITSFTSVYRNPGDERQSIWQWWQQR